MLLLWSEPLFSVQTLSSKMMEQEMHNRRLAQEQIDAFTLDMNSAYARLKGIEEAIDSESCMLIFKLMSC